MNWRVIGALVSKDSTLFFRNRLFALITLLGLIAYIAIYLIMPQSVDETLEIGLYSPAHLASFEMIEEEGLRVRSVESEDLLREGVTRGDYVAGIALPPDMVRQLMSGQRPKIGVYFTSDIPPEIRESVEVIIKELAYRQTGQALAIEVDAETLGQDMMGMQIPPRDRLRPLLAIFLLIAETMGLASLINEEVERRTAQALLVTPMSARDLFVAKAITGVSLAFGQSVVFMAIVGGMSRQPPIILLALLLGSVMVTGIGFLIAALGRDFMSTLAWGMAAFVILSIPALGVMFPGAITGWVEFVPSYYLVDTVHRVTNFGAGWSDTGFNLLILLGFNVALNWIGIIALRRKLR